MNTPFKMKPGRGNMPKTGNGLPTPLRQDHGGDIELTKRYTKGRKKIQGTKKYKVMSALKSLNVDVATTKGYLLRLNLSERKVCFQTKE
jgi:hypothetical protein